MTLDDHRIVINDDDIDSIDSGAILLCKLQRPHCDVTA